MNVRHDKRMMLVPVLLMIALSILGAAYAHWTDMIKMNGIVKTGSLTAGFTRIVAEWDKEDWLRYYGLNPEDKDVGDTFCWLENRYTDVHTNKTIYRKLWCYVNNSYGEYWGINKFTIDNAGTVPVVIANVSITYDPDVLSVREVVTNKVWEFTDIATGKVAFNVWLYKEPPPPPTWLHVSPQTPDWEWEIDPPWMFPAPWPEALVNNQIDPCDELLCELCVHVKQSAPQCHTWYFDVEIGFVNWDP